MSEIFLRFKCETIYYSGVARGQQEIVFYCRALGGSQIKREAKTRPGKRKQTNKQASKQQEQQELEL